MNDDLHEARALLKAIGWVMLGCAFWLGAVWLVLIVCGYFLEP